MRMKATYLRHSGLLLLLLLAACSNSVDPVTSTDGGPDQTGKRAEAIATTTINNYVVAYEGRTFDGQQTTFAWNVLGTGTPPPLTYFLVELPDCAPAPVAWEPSEGHLYAHPTMFVTGMKWLLPIQPDDYVGRRYSLTFPGNVPEGTVRSLVNAGRTTELGEIPGPCAGAPLAEYSITGDVYVDTDGDGLRGPAESGIANVVVELLGPGSAVETFTTGLDGAWTFQRAAGTYTVRVDTLGYADRMNGVLRTYWDATTDLDLEIAVGPDSFDNGFGFVPRADDLITALEDDTIATDGETTIWWKQQLMVLVILQERGFDPYPNWIRDAYFEPEEMMDFINRIRGLYLADPFMFTQGDEFRSAYGQLRRVPQTEVEELRQELLTTEFNAVSDRGIVGQDPALQAALLAWGESLVYLAEQDAGKAGDEVRNAIRIFRAINTGGGGGIDD